MHNLSRLHLDPRIAAYGAAFVLALLMARGSSTQPALRVEWLMAGTPYETPLYVLESGQPGPDLLVLAGVHGDEPGAWMAAERRVVQGPPQRGSLLIIPKANAQAVQLGVRSTPRLGDLNRVYLGGPRALPMSRMADAIVDAVRRHDVDVFLDLHESWSFYQPPPPGEKGDVDLAGLGQTISPHLSQPSRGLAADLVLLANAKIPAPRHFYYHEFPPDHVDGLLVALPPGTAAEDIPRKSALDLPSVVPGLASILVEVGQQQPLEARIAQQLDVIEALVSILGEGSRGGPGLG